MCYGCKKTQPIPMAIMERMFFRDLTHARVSALTDEILRLKLVPKMVAGSKRNILSLTFDSVREAGVAELLLRSVLPAVVVEISMDNSPNGTRVDCSFYTLSGYHSKL